MEYNARNIGRAMTYYISNIGDCIDLKSLIFCLPTAYATYFFGNWYLVPIFFLTSFADLLFGIWASINLGTFRWELVGRWVLKTLTHCLTIIAVGIITFTVSVGFGCVIPILNFMLVLLIAMEMSSVLRNAAKAGLPVHPIVLTIVNLVSKTAYQRLTYAIDLERRARECQAAMAQETELYRQEQYDSALEEELQSRRQG